MKCILHIGTEKTGTTTLQHFFDLNRNLLRSNRILYTESAGRFNNRQLPVAAYSPSRRDDYTKINGIRSDEELVSHQKTIVQCLSEEIERANDVDTVVFSSEHIHSRLRTHAELETLHRILKNLGFKEVLILVYLREQVQAVSSLYNTHVIYEGRTSLPPEPNKEEYWQNICDHQESLCRYRKVFGHEFVKPRLFSKDTLLGGSIVFDFLQASQLEVSKEKLKIPADENESISHLGLEILRRLNSKVPMWLEDGSQNPIRSSIPSFFRISFKEGQKFKLSPDLANQYRNAYREINEWVRREYFPERTELFSINSDVQSSSNGFDEKEIDQIVDVLRQLCLEKGVELLGLSGEKRVRLVLERWFNRVKAIIKRCNLSR